MRKTLAKWKTLSGWFRGFLILAFVFLIVGAGTLGSFTNTGKSYELKTQGSSAKEPAIVFAVDNLKEIDEDGKETTTNLTLVAVYMNIGAIYAEPGEVATVKLARSYSADGSYGTVYTGYIENMFTAPAQDGEDAPAEAAEGGMYNWVQPFAEDFAKIEDGIKPSTARYYKLTSPTHNIVINEIVFVAETLDESDNRTGERVVMPATIYDGDVTVLPREENESRADALKGAGALLDAQRLPSSSQSSFFRFGKEEAYTLSTIREMRAGGSYDQANVGYYLGDTVYGALGIDLIAFGTVIFGMSPFGLRIFPMLASFGVLVFGFLLARKLFKSDKAGFVFALLYALCNFSFGLGHLGTPLTIGVFFFVASVYFMHKFYASGMRKANVASCAPLALSGLFMACAILTNGAYVIAAVGVCALFALGMLRQQRARRYFLDKAIAEAEAEEVASPAPAVASSEEEEGEKPALSEGKRKVADVLHEFRYKNTVAPVVFGLCLLLGAFLLSVLSVLPVSNAYVRMYDDPSAPILSVFGLGWKAFAGGFIGENLIAAPQSVWSVFYTLFTGTGTSYAVTAIAFNAVAALAALAGAVYAVYRIVRLALIKEHSREERAELRAVAISFGGFALSLILTSFAKGGLAFVLLAYLFGFILFGGAVKRYSEKETSAKAVKIVCIVGIVLLAACFLLSAVFTFSIPLPASFMDGLFA